MNDTDFRNSLIYAATSAELRLIDMLNADSRLKGRFEFQKKIGRFYVDFYIADKNLAIELDGSSHISKQKYDNERTILLLAQGVRVIRFQNSQVFKYPQTVIRKIFNYSPNIKRKKTKSKFLQDHVNLDWVKSANKKVNIAVFGGLRGDRKRKPGNCKLAGN